MQPLPFAGQEQAISFLYHHLTEPTIPHPTVFIGRPRIGKTSLVQQVKITASSDLICIYVPLKQTPLVNEYGWLNALVETMLDTLSIAGHIVETSSKPETAQQMRDWLEQDVLPAIFRVIRQHRRLLLLLDDLEMLHHAIQNQTLPEDSLQYLHNLLHPQFGIASTLNLRYEDELRQFAPLIQHDGVYRLSNLSQDVVEQSLKSALAIEDDAVQRVYRLTGGEPELLQLTAQHLIDAPDQPVIAENAKTLIPAIYAQTRDHFQRIWRMLSRDEQLVLTAVASLAYDRPLQAIDTDAVEKWLIETDYPLDPTTINAAIRGLEYLEVINRQQNTLVITTGLMQTWLFENARLDDEPDLSEPPRFLRDRSTLILIAAGLLVLFLLAVTLSLNSSSPETGNEPPIATVTLDSGQ